MRMKVGSITFIDLHGVIPVLILKLGRIDNELQLIKCAFAESVFVERYNRTFCYILYFVIHPSKTRNRTEA